MAKSHDEWGMHIPCQPRRGYRRGLIGLSDSLYPISFTGWAGTSSLADSSGEKGKRPAENKPRRPSHEPTLSCYSAFSSTHGYKAVRPPTPDGSCTSCIIADASWDVWSLMKRFQVPPELQVSKPRTGSGSLPSISSPHTRTSTREPEY